MINQSVNGSEPQRSSWANPISGAARCGRTCWFSGSHDPDPTHLQNRAILCDPPSGQRSTMKTFHNLDLLQEAPQNPELKRIGFLRMVLERTGLGRVQVEPLLGWSCSERESNRRPGREAGAVPARSMMLPCSDGSGPSSSLLLVLSRI